MKTTKLFVCIAFITTAIQAQKKDFKLFKLGDTYTQASEYRSLFNQGVDTTKTSEELQKEFQDNLKLMVDYKLKLGYAATHGYDTLPVVKRDMKRYKSQLATPYLLDREELEKLQKEAYERSKTIVKASHILVKYVSETDTIAAFTKIKKIREEAISGVNFQDLAVKYSEDPSVAKNKGDLGYFSTFRMVYPFENAAYNTPVGQISEIVKTSFGYHILKIADKKASKGKIEVAHIMLAGFEKAKEDTIQKIYQGLQEGGDFQFYVLNYSEDKNSKRNSGKIRPFLHGSSIPMEFQDAAFALEKPGDYSKPVKSHVGWHIIQLVKKYGHDSYQDAKPNLAKQIKRDVRGKLPKEVAFNRLKEQLKVKAFKENTKVFESTHIYGVDKDSLQAPLFVIGNDTVVQNEFKRFVYNRRVKKPMEYYVEFEQKVIGDYFRNNLEKTNDEFKTTLKHYEDGIVIFELMKDKVWDFARKDTLGTHNYYNNNKEVFAKYGADKSYKDIKGHVQHEYQNFIENKWMDSLRTATPVKFCKGGVKKLAKEYK